MDHVEQELRSQLARVVNTPPMLPGLADRVIRGGRHKRWMRSATVAGGVLVAVTLAGVQLLPVARDRAWTSPATPTRAPQVALAVHQGTNELLDWAAGTLRSRPLGAASAVATVPAGVLLTTTGTTTELALLADNSGTPSTVARGLTSGSVAVSGDGDRVSVVTGSGAQRRLRELELPSGRELRSVSVGPPLVALDEPMAPVGYSDGVVLLTLGEGSRSRAALWEPGDDEVIGTLAEFSAALGGGGHARAAFAVKVGGCPVQVAELINSMPSWSLCRGTFVGFSPDGKAVLATGATGDTLVVRDAGDGDLERTLPVTGELRASGWEGKGLVVYTTVEQDRTTLVRCAVRSGACVTAWTFPGTDRIPQPVPRFGSQS